METPINTQPPWEKRGFDLPLALSRAGGQMDLLKEIAGLFLDDYPRTLEMMHKAMQTRDLKVIEHCAHNVKGSACNFGAPEVVFVATELERRARSLEWDGVDALVATLGEALDQLRVQLENLRDQP